MEQNSEKFYERLKVDKDFFAVTQLAQKMYLDKLKETDISQYENFQKTIKIRRALSKESDRGCVLLAVSYLEDALGKYILSYLYGTSKFKKDFVRTNLSSFNSRINFAFSIGLINENLFKDLNVIRDIRNKFAHSFELIELEDDQIKSMMSRINYKFRDINTTKVRSQFISFVYVILSAILPTLGMNNNIKSPIDIDKLIREIAEKIENIAEKFK